MSSILENRTFQTWFAVIGISALALYALFAFFILPLYDAHVRAEKEARALAEPYNIYEQDKILLLRGQANDDGLWIAVASLQSLMEPGHCDIASGPNNYNGTVYIQLYC